MDAGRYIPVLILAAAVAAVQLFTLATGSEYYLTQLTMSAYYALVIIGLCTLMGYAGQISLGHAGFFAIGGYTVSVMTTYDFSGFSGSAVMGLLGTLGLASASGGELHLSPWVSLAAALVITVAVAFIIGIPILKLKGHYLAMASLGFGLIIYRIVLGTRIFGEADGISDVPGFAIAGGLRVSGSPELRIQNYYIAWTLVIIGTVMLINLVKSRAGRALRSIHGSEEAAMAMGVNASRYKLYVFVISAVFASLAGAFMAHLNGGIGPSEADVMKSVKYVAIVAAGGMANLWGALTMGVLLNYISLRGYLGSYDDAFFGAILIAIMLFAPEGLINPAVMKTAAVRARSLIDSIKKKTGRGGHAS
ncbi:MAG: branched-chain amino acid ABC transporter permease [Spirochaetes bacterium]|jgi:branched-chain amino acid transport system permease protein|nr:branched-chain amino acid ABC transporter permease [Spirochaetota bacterium]